MQVDTTCQRRRAGEPAAEAAGAAGAILPEVNLNRKSQAATSLGRAAPPRIAALLAGCLLALAAALADRHASSQQLVARLIPEASTVGSGRLSFLIWDFYDAILYAPQGRWAKDAPYALSLHYLREFTGAQIAKSSGDAIRDLGFADETRLATWEGQMAAIFPDVDATTTLTGVRDEAGATSFYRGDKLLGAIGDPAFADWFFGIWLDESTIAPELRAQLLGVKSE